MAAKSSLEVHETAFFTSTFRALHEELSKDSYAKLWRDARTENWVRDYLSNVSTAESYAHCMRNRYFMDTIKRLRKKNAIEVVINFGSGFSMYPFLLDKGLIHVEIDKPELIAYKQSKIAEWQANITIPERTIHFIGCDFSENYERELLPKLLAIKENKACFILIEGVLFFLNPSETERVFHFFNRIQNVGDFIGSASFRESVRESMAYKRLLDYMGIQFTEDKKPKGQTIEDEFYKSREGYVLKEHQDYFSLSHKYDHVVEQEKDMVLNEHFYLLEKIE